MIIDLNKPIKLSLEKFEFDSKKDDLNSFAIKKLIKKKYESSGKLISGESFEENLLVEFIRRHKALDKYAKVKLGEYKQKQRVDDYNREVLELLSFDDVQKLLFLCRICSYIGDPSFPDFIVNKSLRFVYTGDELIPEKLIFIALANILNFTDIKLSTLDFEDYKHPENLEIDMIKTLESAMETLSKRVNIDRAFEDTGIDLTVFKRWIEKKSIDTDEFAKIYEKFIEKISSENMKETLSKLDGIKLEGDKEEKLKTIRESLGLNIILAHDVLNVYEIVNH